MILWFEKIMIHDYFCSFFSGFNSSKNVEIKKMYMHRKIDAISDISHNRSIVFCNESCLQCSWQFKK